VPQTSTATELDVVSVAFEIEVYPNPFADRLTIEFELDRPTLVVANLFNILGQKIEGSSASEMRAERQRIEWHITGGRIPSGLYLLQLRIGERLITRRVVYTSY